jgi:hypothetical protein
MFHCHIFSHMHAPGVHAGHQMAGLVTTFDVEAAVAPAVPPLNGVDPAAGVPAPPVTPGPDNPPGGDNGDKPPPSPPSPHHRRNADHPLGGASPAGGRRLPRIAGDATSSSTRHDPGGSAL